MNKKNTIFLISGPSGVGKDTVIKTLNEFGVNGNRSIGNPGVWVEDSKIAAVGVKISEGISSHGFSINLTTNLSYFDFIVPCGIPDKSVCSLYSLGIKSIDSNHFRERLIKNFSFVFNLPVQTCSPDEIEHMPFKQRLKNLSMPK